MSLSFRIALCLAALLPARIALADDDTDIKVDVVVNMTEAGKRIPRPTPDHPAYYYPVTRGYTERGASLTGENPPPPTVEVQRLIAKALADQGYLVATRHPPSLVLILWWGYMAPEIIGASQNGMAPSSVYEAAASGSGPSTGMSFRQSLSMPVNIAANHNEMEELVFGSEYAPDPLANDGNHPSIRLEALTNASRVPRYYMIISAMDFKSAEQKKPIVLWTARISTGLWSHTLEQVLPTLIAQGAPMFGRDSDGPQITSAPTVPMGHVIVGTPVLKTSTPASAEH